MRNTCDMEQFTEHTPPNMELLFGYQGHRRWVAFYWGKKIGFRTTGYCFDGEAFSPLNQLAWETFFNHLLIVAMNHQRIDGRATKRFEFGDEHQPSSHWLLLDRRERSLFAAPKPCSLVHMKAVISAESDQPAVTVPDLKEPYDSAQRSIPLTNRSLQMVQEMKSWLDGRKVLLEKNGQWPVLS